MKTKRRMKAWHFLLIIVVSAIALILLTFLALDLSGFRYVTYETENHGDIRFIGKVDKAEHPLSGKIYFSDGSDAKISAYTDKLVFADLSIPSSEGGIYLIEYSNGDTYIGQVDGMLRNGQGRLTFAGGDIYEGDFHYGEINGNGSYYYLSGDIYVGEFSKGLKWGQGSYTWAPDDKGKSDIYVGQYSNDMRNGEGKYTWADGSIYEGSYVNDAKQGKGKMTFDSGDTYEGDYLNDMRTGKGVYSWADGESYEGDFLENSITGYGTYYWTSGSNRLSYEGYFRDGKIVFVEQEEPGQGSPDDGEAPEQAPGESTEQQSA